MSNYLKQRFGRTVQVRYYHDHPILPLGSVQNKPPMYKPRLVNNYTPEGRELIHKGLPRGLLDKLIALMRTTIPGRSVEYHDNRLSLFAGQLGKCAITGRILEVGECEVHHIVPVSMGGDDSYKNLIFITTPVHKLLHATQAETVIRYLTILNLNDKMLNRLNRYRNLMNLNAI